MYPSVSRDTAARCSFIIGLVWGLSRAEPELGARSADCDHMSTLVVHSDVSA
jgi:hypothetical protein